MNSRGRICADRSSTSGLPSCPGSLPNPWPEPQCPFVPHPLHSSSLSSLELLSLFFPISHGPLEMPGYSRRLSVFNISLILLYFHPLPHPCTHTSTPSDYTISAGEESSHPSPYYVPTWFANTIELFHQVCFSFHDQRRLMYANHLPKLSSILLLEITRSRWKGIEKDDKRIELVL